jgi:tetratricopeptide (TPR) repeat protein
MIFLAHTTVTYGVGDNWTHYQNGLRFLKQGKYGEALGNFNYYLYQPEMHRRMFGVAFFGRGLLFQTQGNDTQALQEFKKAVENDLHPEVKISDKAYMNIGTIFMKRKLYQDAVYAYLKALENNPGNGLAHYYLGLAHFKMGNYERAEKASREARRLGVTLTALSDELAKKGFKTDESKPEVSLNKANEPEPEASINKANEPEPEASIK